MTDPGSLRGAVDLSALVNRSEPAPAGPTDASGFSYRADTRTFADFVELSRTVPVVVQLTASWSDQSKQVSATLDRLVAEGGGRWVLVAVDAEQNPQLVQAFGAQAVPTVVGLVAGRPVGLFQGAIPDEQVRAVIEQLLQLAAQQGVTGTAPGAADAETREPEPEPLPPLHQEAYDAIERGDFQAAIAAYQKAIAQNPADALAKAGLAQVSLLARLQGKAAEAIRRAAAEHPSDVAAALDVADLDISGGHVEDAFDRLLTLFPSLDAEGRETVRKRLLELFEVVGIDDPRVAAARRRLTSLLY